MATYSPFNRYYTVDFTAGQNQGDRGILTMPKSSVVFVQHLSGTLRTADGSGPDREYSVYYYSSGYANLISRTNEVNNSPSAGVESNGSFVPSGAEIRTTFQTSSGTATLRLHIFEID